MSTTRPNPQAFATGTYPAGAGGSLTGVGPDIGADIGGLNLAFARIDTPTSPNFGGSQVADEFDSAAGIGSLGSGVVASGYLSNNPGGYTLATPTGSTFGNMTGGGGLAAAFDGNANTSFASSAYAGAYIDASPTYIGKAFASGANIGKVVATSPNDTGFSGGYPGQPITLTIYSKATAPSSYSDGTVLATTTFSDANALTTKTFTFTPTANTYIWLVCSSTAHIQSDCAELQYYTAAASTNITTVSTAYTAASVPTQATIVAEWQDVSTTAVLNTDITFEVSRDGGTTWAAVTMTSLGTSLVSGALAIKGTVDISAQPSGTSMKWRIKTFNTKEQRVHGVWLQWK